MKHLIFDAGGVLVYPRLGEWNIPYGIHEIIGSRAEDIRTEAYRRAYEKAAVWLDESRLVKDVHEERVLREKFVRSLNDDMRWQMTEGEIAALSDDFTFNIDRYGFFDDILPFFTKWKERYSLGLLSDAMPSILLFLEQFGALSMFDGAVISAHVGATKPDGKMYAAILEKLHANPADCVFVDDRINNLEGAQAAGIAAIQMARAEFMPEKTWKGPVAHNFTELDALLGELT